MKLAFMSFSMMREAFLGKMDADTLCAVAAERLLNEGRRLLARSVPPRGVPCGTRPPLG